jgi:hypothetical protein
VILLAYLCLLAALVGRVLIWRHATELDADWLSSHALRIAMAAIAVLTAAVGLGILLNHVLSDEPEKTAFREAMPYLAGAAALIGGSLMLAGTLALYGQTAAWLRTVGWAIALVAAIIPSTFTLILPVTSFFVTATFRVERNSASSRRQGAHQNQT